MESLLVPLLFALLLAILLDRLVKLLSRLGINRIIGISISVGLAMSALVGVGDRKSVV